MKDIAERLAVEVPKQIEALKAKGGPTAADRVRAQGVTNRITKEGKPLMFGGDDVKAEELFQELAFSLAVSALDFDEKHK